MRTRLLSAVACAALLTHCTHSPDAPATAQPTAAIQPAAHVTPRLSYPPTAKGDVVEDYHGTSVADPYRWLE
ncbi:MAG TPA: hypothetical protein VFO83_13725, partial [Aggregicoccus sp.]|nr:hypothetical protein [Aggregicoccus sp.]